MGSGIQPTELLAATGFVSKILELSKAQFLRIQLTVCCWRVCRDLNAAMAGFKGTGPMVGIRLELTTLLPWKAGRRKQASDPGDPHLEPIYKIWCFEYLE